jgi:hypothetical protein
MKVVRTFFVRKDSCEHRHALLVERGRKWSKVVFVQHPIRVEKVDNKIADDFVEIDYSVRKAKSILKKMCLGFYGTKANTPKSVKSYIF